MDEITNAQHTRSGAGSFPAFGLGAQEALEYRKRFRGMIGVASKVPLKDRSVLSLVYTPGVAAPCLEIAKAPLSSFDYTMRGNTIALDTQDAEAIITACLALRPTFGGICLSGIAAPRCFTVADHLARSVNIPVLHAEQHATAAAI